MQAIILAAGMGKRLGELTQNNTKCMIKVNEVTLIERLLSQLSSLTLSRVIIVIGYKGQELKDYIGDRYKEKLNIEYVNNPIYDKTNNIYSLSLVKQQLQEDDTLLIESDLIFDEEMFSLILNSSHPNIALVAKYQTWMDGTMICIDSENNIINFTPKQAFRYSDIDSYYKTVNIYKFSKNFAINKYVPFLEAYCKALGNNEYYEQVLRVITLLDKTELKAIPITHQKWYEIDDIQDLDIAEALFTEKNEEKLKRFYGRYGGFWRFPEMLDFCYLTNPYYPSERMKSEMQANFNTLLTDYPSGMRVNSLIASKCFKVKQEYILPGNGAAELIKSLMEYIEGKIGIVYPTFEEYSNRCKAEDLEIFTPKNPDFRYDAQDLITYFETHPVSNLLLINPDNPSGNFLHWDEICALANWCSKRNIRFIVDESFIDFSENYTENTLLCNELLETYPHLVVIKSISKSYGVPGLRLGILASADKELIERIRKDIPIWNINSFAEFFMQIFAKYEADYHHACKKLSTTRQSFMTALQKIEFLRIIPSSANYFLCEVYVPYTSHELAAILLKDHNILIKDCSSKNGFYGRNYIRIAIRSDEENNRLVWALNKLWNMKRRVNEFSL